MKVTYVSACFDSSGYAEAARNNILALSDTGVAIEVVPVSFEQKKADLGGMGKKIHNLVTKNPSGKIQILHLTPHHYPTMVSQDKYNIGYSAWETSRFPYDWVPKLNCLDELWVPSEYNVQACKDSGVTVPVFCMPHVFDKEVEKETSSGTLDNIDKEDFVFYSIFQWLERKNPVGLLRAYLTEFKPEEKVVLVLKTFLVTPGNSQETEKIRQEIKSTKKTLYMDGYPRVILISNLLTRAQMHLLHQRGDCYVSLHKCEGFGIPIAEAMIREKPVIATGYGGPVDFVHHEETGLLTGYMLAPVSGMPWEMYKGYMNWAEPDLLHARKLMRWVFENRDEAGKMGKRAKVWIEGNLNKKKLGTRMKKRLLEIGV